MIKKQLLSLIFAFMMVLSACDNPDFASYKSYEQSVSIRIIGNLFVIEDIKDVLFTVANEYASEIALTQVEYNLNSALEGTIKFYYGKVVDDETIVVILELDTITSTVKKVLYQKGHSKEVSTFGIYVKNTSYDVRDIHEETLQILVYKGVKISSISSLKFTFVNQKIRVNSYDMSHNPIYGYEYSLKTTRSHLKDGTTCSVDMDPRHLLELRGYLSYKFNYIY